MTERAAEAARPLLPPEDFEIASDEDGSSDGFATADEEEPEVDPEVEPEPEPEPPPQPLLLSAPLGRSGSVATESQLLENSRAWLERSAQLERARDRMFWA